ARLAAHGGKSLRASHRGIRSGPANRTGSVSVARRLARILKAGPSPQGRKVHSRTRDRAHSRRASELVRQRARGKARIGLPELHERLDGIARGERLAVRSRAAFPVPDRRIAGSSTCRTNAREEIFVSAPPLLANSRLCCPAWESACQREP